jgi:hypothetical protein
MNSTRENPLLDDKVEDYSKDEVRIDSIQRRFSSFASVASQHSLGASSRESTNSTTETFRTARLLDRGGAYYQSHGRWMVRHARRSKARMHYNPQTGRVLRRC